MFPKKFKEKRVAKLKEPPMKWLLCLWPKKKLPIRRRKTDTKMVTTAKMAPMATNLKPIVSIKFYRFY